MGNDLKLMGESESPRAPQPVLQEMELGSPKSFRVDIHGCHEKYLSSCSWNSSQLLLGHNFIFRCYLQFAGTNVVHPDRLIINK